MARAREEIEIVIGDPVETLKRCGGYYECPKDNEGKRFGPLVAYAGTYIDHTGLETHYVGDVYYNFAKAEQYYHVIDHFAEGLVRGFLEIEEEDVFLGAPRGGILLAGALGRIMDSRVIFAEKKTKAPTLGDEKEASAIMLDRHELRRGDKVVIVEDVCNNFSTTEKILNLVEQSGGRVLAIVCVINRSLCSSFRIEKSGLVLPVFSLKHVYTPQFIQEHQEVINDVSSGNVVWEPKKEWRKLEEAMRSKLH